MSKHTPGPWTIELPTENWEKEDGRVYGIRAQDGTLIVETDAGVYPPKIADARLIAAAPEMLEALKRARYLLFYGTDTYFLVRDVIDKAEGES